VKKPSNSSRCTLHSSVIASLRSALPIAIGRSLPLGLRPAMSRPRVSLSIYLSVTSITHVRRRSNRVLAELRHAKDAATVHAGSSFAHADSSGTATPTLQCPPGWPVIA
jgi:hypothetical protein